MKPISAIPDPDHRLRLKFVLRQLAVELEINHPEVAARTLDFQKKYSLTNLSK